ncbi:uncharacterized protein VTP21DRAFT_6553 [Calcarisporiella thermophila]|uniref:uncharacterized protein n=1 Tax=Calcarisporiella thermophila TaxID=911321 RepID=UPI0037430780
MQQYNISNRVTLATPALIDSIVGGLCIDPTTWDSVEALDRTYGRGGILGQLLPNHGEDVHMWATRVMCDVRDCGVNLPESTLPCSADPSQWHRLLSTFAMGSSMDHWVRRGTDGLECAWTIYENRTAPEPRSCAHVLADIPASDDVVVFFSAPGESSIFGMNTIRNLRTLAALHSIDIKAIAWMALAYTRDMLGRVRWCLVG